MFSIEEATAWTADEAVARLRQVIPTAWAFDWTTTEDGWHVMSLKDGEDELWSGEHADPKILALDALGWLRLRNHKLDHPVWKPREREVPLYRPPVAETIPDPPDLDPKEVDAVYRSSVDENKTEKK